MFTPHKCDECGYFTTSMFFMNIHLKRHTKQKITFDCAKNELEEFSCNQCPFKTQLVAKFSQHLQESKCKTEVTVIEGREKSATAELSYNSNDIKRYRSFYSHLHKCKMCPYLATSAFFIINHARFHQTSQKHFNCEAANLEKFFCSECQFSTTYFQAFIQHIKNDPFCLKQSKRYKKVLNHPSDNEIEWYKCEKCDYKAKHPETVKTHLLSKHTSSDVINWHKCEQCDYKGKRHSDLSRHLSYRHTSADKTQWYQCAHCSHKSKYLGNLKKHVMNIHTPYDKIKWNECQHCGWKTKRRCYLRKHIQVMHTYKWYKCKQCDYMAKLPNLLKKHLLSKHTSQM